MFTGITAWFSASVSRNKFSRWRENGGVEAPVDTAQFLFSEDATSEDTERVFGSAAYLEEHLAVFHGNYISACHKRGDPKLVNVGHYFLPPKDVQEIARTQMMYVWETDGYSSDAEPQQTVTATDSNKQLEKQPSSQAKSHGHQNSSNQLADTVRNKTIHGDSARLKQHNSTNKQTNSPKKQISSEKNHQASTCNSETSTKLKHKGENKHDNVPRNDSDAQTPSTSSLPATVSSDKDTNDRGRSARKRRHDHDTEPTTELHSDNLNVNARKVNKKVQSSEEQEMWRLEDLAKVTGILDDFVVGTSGCDVFLKTSC